MIGESSSDWKRNYSEWVAKVMNSANASNTGVSSNPPGLVGQQHMGQPKQLNEHQVLPLQPLPEMAQRDPRQYNALMRGMR